MKNRIIPLSLALILCLAVLPSTALAAPAANTEVAQITVAIPYIPGLEITFTNMPHIAGEHNLGIPNGDMQQLKFYFGSDTTIAFNQDVTLYHYSGEYITCKADVPIKAHDYQPIGAFNVNVITSPDGSYELTNDNDINIVAGQKVIMLAFASVDVYSYNMTDEGYTPVDLNTWKSSGASPSAAAASATSSAAATSTTSSTSTAFSGTASNGHSDFALKAITDKVFNALNDDSRVSTAQTHRNQLLNILMRKVTRHSLKPYSR